MEYQELELGIAKKLNSTSKSQQRQFNYQLIINICLFVWTLSISVALMYNCYQVQVLHWHLNATHIRVRELEMWQRHMCAIRHYNCPAVSEPPEYTDDWDWDNFPTMDDYSYDDPFTDHYERNKREIVAETTDGVPINTQPYADVKRINETKRRRMASTKDTDDTTLNFANVPINQPGYHSPAWPPTHKAELKLYQDLENPVQGTSKSIQTRSSRVMITPDKSTEQITEQPQKPSRPWPKLKALNSRDYQDEVQPTDPYPIRRRPFRQRIESFEEEPPVAVTTILKPTRRHIPAAHFHGDTSKYALGIHQNYKGNGHLKHLDRTYIDWVSSDWMKQTNADGIFDYSNGKLTINEEGLYFVYAQIFYVDDHDLNGYHVYRNNEMILQCTTMTHSTTRVRKSNTCYTAGVEKLSVGDEIYVRDLSNERFSLFEKGKSFFGALKLSDMRSK